METELDLEQLAQQYIEVKKKEGELKKQADGFNKTIKKEMLEKSLTSIDTPAGRLETQERTSTSFDEEKLIEYLKSIGKHSGVIKTKEYIDYDVLESAIYNEILDEEEVKAMDEYKITKKTVALVVK